MALAEYAPSRGPVPQGPSPEVTWPQDFSPQIENRSQFSHLLQQRISLEWRPLLLENGEGCPAARVEKVRKRADIFGKLVASSSQSELNGNGSLDVTDELVKQASYLKIATIDAATSLKVDVGSFVYKKTTFDIYEFKYHPDRVYQLIELGMTPAEAMAHLKDAYKKGEAHFFVPNQLTEQEVPYRGVRFPWFKDPHQEIIDIWQRRAFGKYLVASERLPNVFGEAAEFLDEFEGMTSEEINSLAQNNRLITAEDKEGNDPTINKLIRIGGEAGDVIIGDDGYTAALNRDQIIDGNVALDRMISKYKKTKRLVRLGISEDKALNLLRETEHRQRYGLRLPFAPNPAVAAVLFSS